MKAQFREFYSPASTEFEHLWSDAIIVFDANVLLNLFRYSEATRDEWLELLKKDKARLWLPHQVALEFHKNRRFIAHQQEKAFEDVEKALFDAEKSIRGAIDGLRRHPTLEAEELSVLIEHHMKKVRKKFKRARSRHFQAVISQEAHDQTLEEISTLYGARVGEPYSKDQLGKLYKEGAERYRERVPPGYMDAPAKEGDGKYGDLVLWRQILDYGAKTKKPLIFVTDDAKEDWWQKASGKTFGPRPELVAEYFDAAGKRAHFYQPRAFLKIAMERGEKISAEAIAEAHSVSSVRGLKTRLSPDRSTNLHEYLASSRDSLHKASVGASIRDEPFEHFMTDIYRKLNSTHEADESFRASLRDSTHNLPNDLGASSVFRMLAAQEALRSAIYNRKFDDTTAPNRLEDYLASLEVSPEDNTDEESAGDDDLDAED